MSDTRDKNELSPPDRKILRAALIAGHLFEKVFDSAHEAAFRKALDTCGSADSPLVQKLAELAPKVSLALGPKHLMTLLVPLERLNGRAIRDEEFLFSETDGSRVGQVTTGHGTATVGHVATAGRHVVLCENIRSAFNVGSIYRTAETFGGQEVWLSGYSPDPQKTAMGADALVSTRRFDRTTEALEYARSEGFQIIALENSPGAIPLDSFSWPEKSVLVLGNERFGVDSQTLAACDHVVRIATVGQKNSVNVGVAFGIAASRWNSHQQYKMTAETVAGRTAKTPLAAVAPSMAGPQTISAIGYLRGGYADSQVAPRQGAYAVTDGSLSTAVIELESRFEGRPSNFSQALQDLDGFERVWVLFGFHESQTWVPQVRPPRGDGTKRGLFATRAPHRPNRLGLSCVRLLKVDEGARRVTITEHDLLDGTPIYDIKPYVAGADAFPNAKGGWVDLVEKSAHAISESALAKNKVDWLEANREKRLRGFIDEQLRFQPLNAERKRVDVEGTGDTDRIGSHHTIAFRTWRIDFRLITDSPAAGRDSQNVSQSLAHVEILDVRSGYTPDDLADKADSYADKTLHREFQRKTFNQEHRK